MIQQSAVRGQRHGIHSGCPPEYDRDQQDYTY